MGYKMDIKELKKIFIEKNLSTLNELSSFSKVHVSILSDILNGKRQPTSITIDKLILALELSPEQSAKIFFSHI
ncbi:MAG: helix-turn-helix transcriptional regulator [Fusobacteriaceae bacterium]|jgi:transcriptional regulator with XRE-family HTH domain|nr:helix-turn-helix transcriptional regulator [Fusobacteriaceae bacterium]